MFGFALLFVCPFSILITLLGKRELVFVLIVHLFFSYAHVILCHFFLPPGVCLWLFLDFSLFTFLHIQCLRGLTKYSVSFYHQ